MLLSRKFPNLGGVLKGTKKMSIMIGSVNKFMPLNPRFLFCTKVA